MIILTTSSSLISGDYFFLEEEEQEEGSEGRHISHCVNVIRCQISRGKEG